MQTKTEILRCHTTSWQDYSKLHALTPDNGMGITGKRHDQVYRVLMTEFSLCGDLVLPEESR